MNGPLQRQTAHIRDLCQNTGNEALHVRCAAAVEIAAFLDQLEGVTHPVGPLRLDDVQVAQQQDRLGRLAGPRKDRDRSADCFKSGAPTLRDGCACVVGAIPIS